MAIHSTIRMAGSPMMTDSEIMRPFDNNVVITLVSIGSPLLTRNHSTTVSCPANIAPNNASPHRLVPINFQTRGSRSLPGGDTGAASAGLSAAVMILVSGPSSSWSRFW